MPLPLSVLLFHVTHYIVLAYHSPPLDSYSIVSLPQCLTHSKWSVSAPGSPDMFSIPQQITAPDSAISLCNPLLARLLLSLPQFRWYALLEPWGFCLYPQDQRVSSFKQTQIPPLSSSWLLITGQDWTISIMSLVELNILLSLPTLEAIMVSTFLILHFSLSMSCSPVMSPLFAIWINSPVNRDRSFHSSQTLRDRTFVFNRSLLSSPVLGFQNALVSPGFPGESSWKCLIPVPQMDLQYDRSSLLGKSRENYFICRFNWLHLNFVFSPIRRWAICSHTPPSPFKWVSRELFVFCY